MRLELGGPVHCTDGVFGELADIVIDPIRRRVTHIVVEPHHHHGLARLVPIELARGREDSDQGVSLHCTVEQVRRLDPVQEFAFLRLGEFPVNDPDWDVGVHDMLALPHYDLSGLAPAPLDDDTCASLSTYDRIPKGEVEIRRLSVVTSADGHHLGRVEGFVLDSDGRIAHLVLERGHLWGRHDVTIPIGAVARVKTDAVTLSLSKDAVRALAPVPTHRWSS